MVMGTWRKMRRVALVAAVLLPLLGTSHTAFGLLFLQDQNSSVAIDPNTQHGMYDWIIDGVNLAPVVGAVGGDDDYRQWFWYRVGATPEASIDTLFLATSGVSDVNFDGFADTAFLRYLGTGFKIEITYTLTGAIPGSRTSDIGEQISISNLSGLPLSLSFFQYGDFQLDPPNYGNEWVLFTNANTSREIGALGYVQETVSTPVPTHREAQHFATTINKLNDGVADNLVDNTSMGPGDITWANQWDLTLNPNQTILISKDKQAIIPEPSTVVLALVGLLGLSLVKRRR